MACLANENLSCPVGKCNLIGSHESFPFTPDEAMDMVINQSGGLHHVDQFVEKWANCSFSKFKTAAVYGIYFLGNDHIDNQAMHDFIHALNHTSAGEPVMDCSFTNIAVPTLVSKYGKQLKDLPEFEVNNQKYLAQYGENVIIYPSIFLSQQFPEHLTIFCIPEDVIGYRGKVDNYKFQACTSCEFQILLEEIRKFGKMENVVFVCGLPIGS